jgi:hypothetical protein
MKSLISQQPLVGSYSNSKLMIIGSNQSVQRYQMKMNSNRKRPLTEDDLKSGISQQPLVRSSANFVNEAIGIKSECTMV